MHLIYSCPNNDEVTDLNQNNLFCYLGISEGSLTHNL